MIFAWQLFILFLFSFFAHSEEKSAEIRLLTNRFRIDGAIEQAAFIIHRQRANQAVILISPNGDKFYANDHPENVFWQEAGDKDIITVFNPTPGPWQAIGKIATNNRIQILTNLNMNVDIFPQKLYQGESLKFKVRLLQNNQPLTTKDYLDNVKLLVNFTPNIPEQEKQPPAKPLTLASLEDEGRDLDEYLKDGVFTVALPVSIAPGNYFASIEASNKVFFRAIEQQVLVFPRPISVFFEQSRNSVKPSRLEITAQSVSVELDSLAIHAEFVAPSGKVKSYQGQWSKDEESLWLAVENFTEYGQYYWNAWVYATDTLTGRELIFPFLEQYFEVANFAAIEKAKRENLARKARRAEQEQTQRQALEKKQAQQFVLISVIGGNFFLLFLAFGLWLFYKKPKEQSKEAVETSQ